VDQKNHRRLLAAWVELASAGMRPSLVLTLPARDRVLIEEIERTCDQYGLIVQNRGEMSHEDIIRLYRRSRAMIFPSMSESFGMPLIEAHQMGLPIVASELDFVRDVCTPVATFDPKSAHSIALAVRRFLGKDEPPIAVVPPSAVFEEVLSHRG
jgi:glycosyltransferase involved in cell wall biosynthesis